MLTTRAVRFCLTGLMVTAVHFAVAIGCIRLLDFTPPVANAVAFAAATALSCLVNTLWSFSSRLSGRRVLRFLLVSVVGCLLAITLSWSADVLQLGYLTGITAVALLVPPFTFLSHNFWTYR